MPKVTAKGANPKDPPPVPVSKKAATVFVAQQKFAEIKKHKKDAVAAVAAAAAAKEAKIKKFETSLAEDIIIQREPDEGSPSILESTVDVVIPPVSPPPLPEWRSKGGGEYVMNGLVSWEECEPEYNARLKSDSIVAGFRSYLGCPDRSCRKFKIIGQGGQGEVDLAYIMFKGKRIPCALKISKYTYLPIFSFHPTEQGNQITLREREANILSITNMLDIFPNFYAGCVTNDRVITFMELLTGWMTFSNFLRGGSEGIMEDGSLGKPFPTLNEISVGGVPNYRLQRRIIRKILAKLSERLQALWALGLVHLDLKPGNFMVKIVFLSADLSEFEVDVRLIDPGSVGFAGDLWVRGLYPSTPGYSLVKDAREQIKEGLRGTAAAMFLRDVSPGGPNSSFPISSKLNEYSVVQMKNLLRQRYGLNPSLPTTDPAAAAAAAAGSGSNEQFKPYGAGRLGIASAFSGPHGGKRRTCKRTIRRKKTHKKKRST